MRYLRLSIIILCLYFIASTCFKQSNDVVSLLGVGYLPVETINWADGTVCFNLNSDPIYIDAAFVRETTNPNFFELAISSQQGKELTFVFERSYSKHFFGYAGIADTKICCAISDTDTLEIVGGYSFELQPASRSNTLVVKAQLTTKDGSEILANLTNVPLIKDSNQKNQ